MVCRLGDLEDLRPLTLMRLLFILLARSTPPTSKEWRLAHRVLQHGEDLIEAIPTHRGLFIRLTMISLGIAELLHEGAKPLEEPAPQCPGVALRMA